MFLFIPTGQFREFNLMKRKLLENILQDVPSKSSLKQTRYSLREEVLIGMFSKQCKPAK
jgi:hypothetical protein